MKTANEIREILHAEAARIMEPRKLSSARMNAAAGLKLFADTGKDEELLRFAELLRSA